MNSSGDKPPLQKAPSIAPRFKQVPLSNDPPAVWFQAENIEKQKTERAYIQDY